MFRNKKNNNGFTLIELLVVISIIALLTSIVLAALAEAKAKARDARRLEDMRTLQTAIAMYQNDHGGSFPETGAEKNRSEWEYSTNSRNNFIENLVNGKYIPFGIKDPNGLIYYYKKGAGESPCASDDTMILFELETNTKTTYPKYGGGPLHAICLR